MDKYLNILNILLVLSHFLIYIRKNHTKAGLGKYLLYLGHGVLLMSLYVLTRIFFSLRLDPGGFLSYNWYLGAILFLNLFYLLDMEKIDLIDNRLIRRSLYILAYGLWILVFIKLVKYL